MAYDPTMLSQQMAGLPDPDNQSKTNNMYGALKESLSALGDNVSNGNYGNAAGSLAKTVALSAAVPVANALDLSNGIANGVKKYGGQFLDGAGITDPSTPGPVSQDKGGMTYPSASNTNKTAPSTAPFDQGPSKLDPFVSEPSNLAKSIANAQATPLVTNRLGANAGTDIGSYNTQVEDSRRDAKLAGFSRQAALDSLQSKAEVMINIGLRSGDKDMVTQGYALQTQAAGGKIQLNNPLADINKMSTEMTATQMKQANDNMTNVPYQGLVDQRKIQDLAVRAGNGDQAAAVELKSRNDLGAGMDKIDLESKNANGESSITRGSARALGLSKQANVLSDNASAKAGTMVGSPDFQAMDRKLQSAATPAEKQSIIDSIKARYAGHQDLAGYLKARGFK